MDDRKKKILYVITKSYWGGAQRYVYDLATHASREKFDVAVVCGGGGLLVQKLKAKGVRTVELRSLERDVHFFKELRSFFELLSVYKEEKPDVVHLNSSKAGGLGALAARLFGIPNITFTAHGWPFKEERPALVRWVIYLATWFTVLLSHHVIVVSKQDEEIGTRMWLARKKIVYVPNALPSVDLLPREKAEEVLFRPEVDSHVLQSTRLVSIAELTRNKGLKYGIDMMRELEKEAPGQYTYTIFGDGEERENLTKEAQELNSKRPRVITFANRFEYKYPNLQEHMPQDLSTNASKYLKAFDIFVLPSIKEGNPYVLLEASAAGLPIVATEAVRGLDIPNMHIVPSKSGRALTEAVQALVQNVPKEAPSTESSFELMLKRTEELY